MRFLCDGEPIIWRYVRVETESNSESWRRAVDPHAIASGQDRAQRTASSRDAKAVLLRDTWAYDKGLLCQQLGLREAMLALIFLLGATCWERLAFAVAVLLVVVVLNSGLSVLQCLVELLGVIVCASLEFVHAGLFSIDVRRVLVLPYAPRYVA